MSIVAMNWAWDVRLDYLGDRDNKAGRRLLLVALGDNANEQGVCWPAVATLAKRCESSSKSVRRWIKEFTKHGLLSVRTRATDEGQTSNLYVLHLSVKAAVTDDHPMDSESTPLDTSHPTPGHGDQGGGTQGDQGPWTSSVPLTTTEPTPTHTPQANDSDHVQGAGAQFGTGLDDSGQPLSGAADTHRKFAMHFDWEPSPEVFAASCLRAGLAPGTSYERPQLAKFTAYFADQPGRRHSESTWVANFVDWIRRDSRFAAQQPSAGGNRHANSTNHAGAGKRTRTAAEARREAEQRRAEQSDNGARAGFVYQGECSSHSGGN